MTLATGQRLKDTGWGDKLTADAQRHAHTHTHLKHTQTEGENTIKTRGGDPPWHIYPSGHVPQIFSASKCVQVLFSWGLWRSPVNNPIPLTWPNSLQSPTPGKASLTTQLAWGGNVLFFQGNLKDMGVVPVKYPQEHPAEMFSLALEGDLRLLRKWCLGGMTTIPRSCQEQYGAAMSHSQKNKTI